jgi:hypothetical protein
MGGLPARVDLKLLPMVWASAADIRPQGSAGTEIPPTKRASVPVIGGRMDFIQRTFVGTRAFDARNLGKVHETPDISAESI